VRESTILTLPPFRVVACILEKANVKGMSTAPAGLTTPSESGPGRAAKIGDKYGTTMPQGRIHTRWEDVKLFSWNVCKGRGVCLEVLCED